MNLIEGGSALTSESRVRRSKLGPQFTTAILLAPGVVGCAALATIKRPELAILATCAVALLLVAFIGRSDLPLLTRPTFGIAVTSALASLAGLGLSAEQLHAFTPLRVAETFGICIGAIIAPTVVRHRTFGFQRIRTNGFATALFGLALAAGATFFAWRGIPILSPDIESGRVDAAVTGTGYLRLLAALSIPAALVLTAIRAPKWRVCMALAGLCVLLFANRSPLLYLIIPFAIMTAASANPRKAARIIAAGVVVTGLLVVSIGTLRVFSQEEFGRYDEYAQDIAARNYLAVSVTAVSHYVNVLGENGALTKQLVDAGFIERKWGTTYFSAFITALPGEQLTLDREVKLVSGRTFLGGGTPPTLAGEGYANFGILGTVVEPLLLVLLLSAWARDLELAKDSSDPGTREVRLTAVRYGYLLTLACTAQVAGIAGASTFPLTGLIVLAVLARSMMPKQRWTAHGAIDGLRPG